MSEGHSTHTAKGSMNANLIAFVFILNFVIIAGVIAIINAPEPPPATPTPAEVAIVATATTVPTETPAPPTATLQPTNTPLPPPTQPPTNTPAPAASLDDHAVDVVAGDNVFARSCAACHGFNAMGISGLGPSMIDNPFINGLSDAELIEFIIIGRSVTDPDNKTGVAMPARGGNPSLSDADIADVVGYIRSLNPDVVVADAPSAADAADDTAEIAEAEQAQEPREAREFTPLTITGLVPPRDSATTERTDPDRFFMSGENAYNFSCASCHGIDGEGVPMFGPALEDSELLLARSGIGVFDMLTQAGPPADPRFGFVHPYRGGYPQLSDDQILQLIGHLYTLIDDEAAEPQSDTSNVDTD